MIRPGWLFVCFSLWAAFGSHAVEPRNANAGTEFAIQLPLPNQRTVQNNSKLQLDIRSHWVEASGYRPVFVELSSVTPATADRNVTIELIANDQPYMDTADGVIMEMTLGEGQRRVVKEVGMLQRAPWQTLKVRVLEEGRELEDLAAENASLARMTGSWEWTESYPAILFIDSDADASMPRMATALSKYRDTTNLPDVRALSYMLPPFDDASINLAGEFELSKGRAMDGEIISTLQRLQTFTMSPFERLPTTWTNYTSLDIILINKQDLTDLVAARPDAWNAIREYVASGGNLWVYGLSPQFDDLEELDLIIGSQDASTWQLPSEDTAGRDLLNILQRNAVAQTYQQPLNGGSYDGDIEVIEEDSDAIDELRDRPPAALLADPRFRIRRLQLGRVTALGVNELAELVEPVHEKRGKGRTVSADRLSWLLSELNANQWRWSRRMGMSLRRANREFWDFLIPGVGAAPVTAFLGLITGFMILIGPVNYFLLQRRRKLYLLLLTVPLGAFVFTTGLYAYALVKDGLGTRSRTRSFSNVDVTGEVTSWSRNAYYAGLVPSSGLRYPHTAAVYPVLYDPARRSGRRRWRQLGNADVRYGPGYLKSRETFQTLVVNRVDQVASIQVTRDEANTLKAVNPWKAVVRHLLVVDEGAAYWCDRLRSKEVATLQQLDAETVREKVLTLLDESFPRKPAGFTPPNVERRRSYFYAACDSTFPRPSFRWGVLEQQISRIATDLLGKQAVAGRHYVAFLSDPPSFVPVGIASARREADMHIVRGSW